MPVPEHPCCAHHAPGAPISSGPQIEVFVRGPMENAVLLVSDEEVRACGIVDPGLDSEDLREVIRSRGLRLTWIFNTHGHFDHVLADQAFCDATEAPVYIHSGDIGLLERLPQQCMVFGFPPGKPPGRVRTVADGATLAVGRFTGSVIHTPGHTPGSCCLRFGDTLIAGDTIFRGSIARTDLPGGSFSELMTSLLKRLRHLPDETRVICGHGPETTMGQERLSNEYWTT